MAFTTRQAASEERSAQQTAAKPSVQLFNDQRASTSAQLKQQQMMTSSQSAPLQRAEDEELLQGKFATAQLMEEEEPLQGKFVAQRVEEEEPLQGKFATAQLMEEEEPIQGKLEPLQRAAEEEEPLQGKFESSAPVQREQKPNNTGMPDNLKSGIESLSGYSMDDVKVHYNSAQPAQLNAHAYAQGTDIHVAPGQEQHLPHEAWHVVQQKQGRVQPTMQMKAGVPVNDDAGLENEADVMGAKAIAPIQRFTDDGTMEKQTGSKIHKGVNAGRATNDNTDIQTVKLSRHHLVNKDSLMSFYRALVNNAHQAGVDAHVQTILGQLEDMTDSDSKAGAASAWQSAKGNKTPELSWAAETKKIDVINTKLVDLNAKPQSKSRDKKITDLQVELSGLNIKIDTKRSKLLPKWNKFQDIFQWFPGNLVEGPASDLRTDDPGSAFDTAAHRTIGSPAQHATAYADIQSYIGGPTLVNATTACASLGSISANFDHVHRYDYTLWEKTPGHTDKYRVR